MLENYKIERGSQITTAIKWLLLATNIAFVIYYISLAIYARPHYDDLHFMWKLQEISIFDYIKDMYITRSGRFGGYLLNGIVFRAINTIGILWIFPLLFIVIGVGSSYYVLQDLLPKANKWWLVNLVSLFYFTYIITNIDFALVYWLCAMGYYLKFPIALLTINLINKKVLTWWQWIILLLAVFTIGAGNEAFSPLFLVFLFINGMYYLHQNKYDFSKTLAEKCVKRICVVTGIIIALMIIVVIAPGNYARMADTTEFHRPSNIISWIKGLVHAGGTYHYFLLFYIPYYLVLMMLTSLLGIKARVSKWLNYNFEKCKHLLVGIASMYVVYIFCTILPSVFLYGDFGIQRNYTHAVYMTMLIICSIGFVIGYMKPNLKKVVSWLSVVGLSILLCIIICNIYLDVPTVKTYANSVDERFEYCSDMQEKGYVGILEVDPLVEPVTIDIKYTTLSVIGKSTVKPMLYYISDTEEFPNEYAYHMRRLYDWNFDIVLKQNSIR